MKNGSLIFCTVLVTLGLVAFGIMNLSSSESDQEETRMNALIADNIDYINRVNKLSEPDFFYDLGPRFGAIKKGDVDTASSIIDFISVEETERVISYKSVSVVIIKNDKQTDIRETGNNAELTEKQIKLLQSLGYSSNFLIRADYHGKNSNTGALEDSYFSPHLTIVPARQATYTGGKEALIKYLEANNKENTTNLDQDKLQPAKLYFTISKKGVISNVRIDRSSGYDAIDKAMIDLLANAPGTWEPAENAKGEKVDQELVISFGMVGC